MCSTTEQLINDIPQWTQENAGKVPKKQETRKLHHTMSTKNQPIRVIFQNIV